MNDFIVKIPSSTDDLFDDENPRPSPSVLVNEYDDEGTPTRAYLYSGDDPASWGGDAGLVGAWDASTGLQAGQSYDENGDIVGTPTYVVDADYWEKIRPLGNNEGRATGHLDSLRWAGHSEAKFLQNDSRYKDDEAPFALKISRVEITAPDPFPGWGWVVEMLSDDPMRDITARAVGIYSDPECTAYLYTTGAFVQDGSHDNNFYTECPAGQRTVNPEQVNFALLLGSVQEGFFNLPEGGGDTEALFWSKDQGAGSEWTSGVNYAVDDEVEYLGIDYICLQAHLSQPGWEPPNVPALWGVV